MRACPRCHAVYQADMARCGIDGAPLVEQEEDPLVGRTIDRYTIEERLGAGAMGCVYRGRHEFLGTEHAIKVLYGDLACIGTLAERFRREARALSRVRHANVVEVTDFGTTEAGLSFLVMTCLEGETLAKVIAREGPLLPSRAARLAKQIAEGLAAVHAHGIVHRDLKPGNVVLSRAGEAEVARVLDFGIAKDLRDPREDRLTQTGYILGTPAYMAPEQAQGGEVGTYSDLYSLGVILYEMLDGSPPFTGSAQQVVMKQVHETAPPLAPAGGLERIAARLLAKAPENRPASAAAVAAELAAFLEAPTGGGPRVLADELRAGAPGGRARFVLAGVALLAAGVAGAAALLPGQSASGVASQLAAPAPAGAAAGAPSPTPVPDPVPDPAPAARPAEPEERARPVAAAALEPAPASEVPAPRRERRAPQPRRAPAPSAGELRRGLDRISAALAAARATLPPSELSRLEERYLELSMAVRPDLDEAERRSIASGVADLGRELRAGQGAVRTGRKPTRGLRAAEPSEPR